MYEHPFSAKRIAERAPSEAAEALQELNEHLERQSARCTCGTAGAHDPLMHAGHCPRRAGR